MAHVIDVKGISYRCTKPRNTPRFVGSAGRVEVGYPAATGGEDVANVVVGRADYCVAVGLVLSQHGHPVVVGIGIRGSIGIYQQVIVGHQVHANRHFTLIHAVDAVH